MVLNMLPQAQHNAKPSADGSLDLTMIINVMVCGRTIAWVK